MENKQNRLKTSLQENQYIVPSYSLYGGNAGFHDYGKLGLIVKNKIIDIWREFFLFDDDICEIETPTIMPYELLKASGHVDRFTDHVVYDGSGNCFRADHLVKDYFLNNDMNDLVNKVDSMNCKELEKYINEYKMILGEFDENLGKHNPIEVVTKNLMFTVPYNSQDLKCEGNTYYLRPELAQGLFVNFKIIQQFLHTQIPFGLAQIGKSYRNEISPKPFVRMREFSQAEIEYFVDPEDKNHPLYDNVKDTKISLITADMQNKNIYETYSTTIDNAISGGLISHKVMGYFLAKINIFASMIGLDINKIRFRQHLPNEMAHYASECWDLETFVNNDWLECIGCADRGCYDLKCHSKNIRLTFRRNLKIPISSIEKQIVLNKKIIGQRYKNYTQKIIKFFDNLSKDKIVDIQQELSKKQSIIIYINESPFEITENMISISNTKKNITYEEIFPHVIEPSFGIDRLMYSIFEHNFWARKEDSRRLVLSLPKNLTPYDIAIFQLYNREDMIKIAKYVKQLILKEKFSCYIDNSSVAIGKRYVRADEMGIKYAITIDPGSIEDDKVTIRDRDSMKQIRVDISDLVNTINSLETNINIDNKFKKLNF